MQDLFYLAYFSWERSVKTVVLYDTSKDSTEDDVARITVAAVNLQKGIFKNRIVRDPTRHLFEKVGKTFMDVPKFLLRQGSKSQNSSHPLSSSPTLGFRVSFLASTRGPNVGRSFVLLLPSLRRPKLESADEVLDFEFVGIPPLPIICSKFHKSSILTIGFSFPCSKNSKMDQRWMARLRHVLQLVDTIPETSCDRCDLVAESLLRGQRVADSKPTFTEDMM
ncbi:hypothetical protein AVEN_68953-1 [Araneus ventricosus]|uniref:Uncharacterized protein n=1 Tax=Araneus ventricosus TaxID=182803 RepID=A0A4Y2HI65_ARAVE|nr:hypothetical protein AVEN_68953-1 [Araneus ventricosus]